MSHRDQHGSRLAQAPRSQPGPGDRGSGGRPRRGGGSLARDPGADARLETQEIQEITQSVLTELPEIFRTVLVLREFEDLSYQEMADVLGISIGTVESRLFRARARFKNKLLQMHPEFGSE